MNYQEFLERKTHVGADHGFDPVFMPDMLFDFQKSLVEWATLKGRAAIFADCGLGKTFMQLTWAENVRRKTGKPVLILTPLAVSYQTVTEGHKIGVDVSHRREGIESGDGLVVTNYERLGYFDAEDFAGVVCDESSILKNFDGEIKKAVTTFMCKTPYRLLCTATAAPNDFEELGTSSEALGYLGHKDMLSKFFTNNGAFMTRAGKTGGRFWNAQMKSSVYMLKPHAERDFWRWICSWARAVRTPADMGFDSSKFVLPDLVLRDHVVKASKPRDGYLFDVPAVGLSEQREDLKNTLEERCQMAADLVRAHDKPAICWTNLNSEADLLNKLIPGSVNVQGSDSETRKESSFKSFSEGKTRVMISKPSIAGFGMNWQHCAHMTFFPSHSYEQFYQSVRRCYRFGQESNVFVDMITTDGQERVLSNLKRKSEAADQMFDNLVEMMLNEMNIKRLNEYTKKEEMPSWL